MIKKIFFQTISKAKPMLAAHFLPTRTIVTSVALRLSQSHSQTTQYHGKDTMTMAQVKKKIIEKLGIENHYSPEPKSRDYLLQYEPKLEDLPPRSMQDSFSSAIIPLSTDVTLRDTYTTLLGRVRLGRLMEDMDIFAVWVCHNHVCIPKLDPNIHLPYTFVTILVDKVEYTDYIASYDKDIRISGHVSWVGRSSMEIVVWLEQLIDGELKRITRAIFMFAARNATNTKSAAVNPLVPGNEKEKEIFLGGEQRKKRRIEITQKNLLQSEPTDEEQKCVHDIFIKTQSKELQALSKAQLPPSAVWLRETELSNFIFSQPENRNAHNKVFGGFLMRTSLEMAWSCAYMFCKRRPYLKRISDIAFRKPVDVNSFITMKGHVLYTQGRFMQIIVITNCFDPALNSQQYTSNIFHYTFETDYDVPEIIPETYSEAVWFIEGRRKFYYAMSKEDVPEGVINTIFQ